MRYVSTLVLRSQVRSNAPYMYPLAGHARNMMAKEDLVYQYVAGARCIGARNDWKCAYFYLLDHDTL